MNFKIKNIFIRSFIYKRKNINKFTLILTKNISKVVYENQYFVISLSNIGLFDKLYNLTLIVNDIIIKYEKFRNY